MESQESLDSVSDQVAPEANANHEPEQQSQSADVQPKVDNQERNWREMRRKNTELEQKVKMQEEVLERLLKAQQVPQQPPEVDEFDQIDDTEVLQKGQVKKLVTKQAEKIAKDLVQKEMEQMLHKQHQSTYLTRLKGQFSDFEEVVNHDSLALFSEQEPELAKTIEESKDPYKMLYQSYKFIKKLGIDKEVPNARHSKEVEKKIEKNAKSVQSPQSFDKRPMAQAFRMTEGQRKDLADEMNFYARRASSVPEMG